MPETERSQSEESPMPENASRCQSAEQKKYLYLSAGLRIPLQDIRFDFSHASGPGGQHVNTTDSAVQLRFNILQCQTSRKKSESVFSNPEI